MFKNNFCKIKSKNEPFSNYLPFRRLINYARVGIHKQKMFCFVCRLKQVVAAANGFIK
jgi:hypothetical protein